jgi:hypothetical protein
VHISFLTTLAAALVLSGCGLVAEAPATLAPIPAGPLGPILARPGGGGPPIECRDLPETRCLEPGAIQPQPGGLQFGDIQRVIVSCENAACTEEAGAFRIEVLLTNGTMQTLGRGGYGGAPQSR